MTYSARSRDRYRVVASVTTGVVAAACLAGTGAVMGTAAAANNKSEHDKAAARQRELDAQPVYAELPRPSAEVTKIKTVTKPGPGPRIRIVRTTGGSGGSSRSTPRKAAPKPPPTKSSGS